MITIVSVSFASFERCFVAQISKAANPTHQVLQLAYGELSSVTIIFGVFHLVSATH